MKNLAHSLLAMACLLAPMQVFSQAEGDAVGQFERRVERIERFLSTPQKLILQNSGSGGYFYAATFVSGPIRYDIRRTDSLVSPLTGYVAVNAKIGTNNACGTVRYLNSGLGWRSEMEAIDSVSRAECFTFVRPAFEARFNYSYQKGSWALKSVTYRYPGDGEQAEPLLSATLGTPVDNFLVVQGEAAKAFNVGWRDAFTLE